MKVIRAARRVLSLNIRKPKSVRIVVIQVFPHVINSLIDPPTIQTAEELIRNIAVYDSMSILVQIAFVTINKKIF